MLSEKVAVIVTTSELETRLSESVSVNVTVGNELTVEEETVNAPLKVAEAVPAVILIKKAPIK